MSRCKACNAMLNSTKSIYKTIVTDKGEVIDIEEDLCVNCRSKSYEYVDYHAWVDMGEGEEDATSYSEGMTDAITEYVRYRRGYEDTD